MHGGVGRRGGTSQACLGIPDNGCSETLLRALEVALPEELVASSVEAHYLGLILGGVHGHGVHLWLISYKRVKGGGFWVGREGQEGNEA